VAQLAELEAMKCIYCDDFSILTPGVEAQIQEIVESQNAQDLVITTSDLAVRCAFSLVGESEAGRAVAELHVTLPSAYPYTPPEVSVVHCSLPRASTSALQQSCRGFVQAEHCPGAELLLQLASRCTEQLQNLQQQEEESTAATAAAAGGTTSVAAQCLGRAVVWFHHIKSSKKKASIASWSAELNTRGFAKPGYPGVLYAEGEKGDVDELLHRMRAQRWKAMAVRAEEWQELPPGEQVSTSALYNAHSGWSGGAGIEFLGESDMGEAAARFTAMGLGDLFKRAVLKMKPVGAAEGGAGGDSDSD